ncbi:MAG: hypothetical protein ACREBQ_05635, partial [Nitrososphaerales archaeon]
MREIPQSGKGPLFWGISTVSGKKGLRYSAAIMYRGRPAASCSAECVACQRDSRIRKTTKVTTVSAIVIAYETAVE